MTRNLLTFILLFSIHFVLGQTIRDLEQDLSIHGGQVKYGDKIDNAKKLHELDPFNIKAVRIKLTVHRQLWRMLKNRLSDDAMNAQQKL